MCLKHQKRHASNTLNHTFLIAYDLENDLGHGLDLKIRYTLISNLTFLFFRLCSYDKWDHIYGHIKGLDNQNW